MIAIDAYWWAIRRYCICFILSHQQKSSLWDSMWWNDALRLLSVGGPAIHLRCPQLRLGHCNWRAAANVSSNARTMNMNLNVFMRGNTRTDAWGSIRNFIKTSWNTCLQIYKWTYLRIYQKPCQNIMKMMKHMPANLQTNMVTFNTSNLIYGSDSFLCASASWFLHTLRTCIDKMVNWKDPALLLNDSRASCGLYVGQYCHWQSPSRF